jgi:hypothetical protein
MRNTHHGGDLDNAIVIYEREMSQENYDKLADVMGVPHMDAKQLGYINQHKLWQSNGNADQPRKWFSNSYHH